MPGYQNGNSQCQALWLSVTIMPGNQNENSKCPALQIFFLSLFLCFSRKQNTIILHRKFQHILSPSPWGYNVVVDVVSQRCFQTQPPKSQKKQEKKRPAVECKKLKDHWPFIQRLTKMTLCYIIDFIVHVSSYFLQSTLHCSCFISFP